MITCSLSIRFQTVKQRYLEGKSLSMSAKLSVQTFRNLPKKSKNLTLPLRRQILVSLIPLIKRAIILFKDTIILRTDPGILKVKDCITNYYYVLTFCVLRLEKT